jgi:hypothetical protein
LTAGFASPMLVLGPGWYCKIGDYTHLIPEGESLAVLGSSQDPTAYFSFVV